MPVAPKPWLSYEFTPKEFKELLGIDPKTTDIKVYEYPNRIVVTAVVKS